MGELKNIGYFGEEITTSIAELKPQDDEEKLRVVDLSIWTSTGGIEAFLTINDARKLAVNILKLAEKIESE